jgi:DNA repair exonuclease SbcCD ATPase subunit
MKKHLLFLTLAILFNLPSFGQEKKEAAYIYWDHELSVQSGEVLFDGRSYYAYTIEIFNTKDNFVRKLWKDQLKNSSEKIKRNIAYGARLAIHDDPLDMHTTYEEEKRTGQVTMSAAFLHNGEAINPGDDPEAHRKAEEMMYEMAVSMNKAAVNGQIEEANKELEKLQQDLEKLRRNNEKLHQTILKNQKDLEKAQNDEKSLEKDVKNQEKDIEQFERKIGEERSTNELKKLTKMQKDLTRLQDKLNRVKSDQIKYGRNIRNAEREIPINEREQVAKEKEIAAQEEKLNQLRVMYQEIS